MLAACLDGFLLRSVKYYPRGAVEVICSPLREKWRGYALDKCLWTGRLTQYSLEREVSRYVDDHPSPPSEI